MIEPSTVQAYRETDYVVHANVPLTLRIDAPNAGLRALHAARGVASSVFITACNPLSRQLTGAENASRQEALAQALRQHGWPFLPGEGRHPSNGWPPEPSWLVLGVSLDAAKALGIQHAQNAIVWCAEDATPRLILLR